MRRVFGAALGLVAFAGAAFAAEAMFELSFEASRNTMTVGDELVLSVEVLHGVEFKLLPPPKDLKFDPFELKRVEMIPPRPVREGIREGYDIILTSFRLGDHEIKPFPIPFVDPKGKAGRVFTDPVKVRVASLGLIDRDASGDIRPIKPQMRLGLGLSPREMTYWGLGGIVGGALFLFLLALLLRRRQRDAESRLSPSDRALLYLQRLKRKKYLEIEDTRGYFDELSAILEKYLIDAQRIGAIGLTTEEFMERVDGSTLDDGVKNRIRSSFFTSDMAKFAKWTPPREECDAALEVIRGIVEDTRPKEDKHEQIKARKVVFR